MLVVLDTNILISALLRVNSIPDKVLSLILEDKINLAITDEILTEYQAVLNRPKFKNLDKQRVMKVMIGLKQKALFVKPG
jgi:uncharacterized protein